ncbi:MAG: coniferyl aldehyde dehydrogenase [Gammaproteobacteria bacterium]|nr:coniferyl aldehyde dehydrogenase [Gammaproteobacteria bacterium]
MNNPQPVAAAEVGNPLLPILQQQQTAFLDNGAPDYKQRIEALNKLKKAIGEYKEEIVAAVQADFGHRSDTETWITEVVSVLNEIVATKSHLKKWMKPSNPGRSISAGMAKSRVIYQPKGVIGIMGAWNYPVLLVLSPLIGVIAAGNSAVIKPSDLTPKTGEVVKKMIASTFDESYISVVTGDVEVASNFTQLPFDHIVYTGSTHVGKIVMKAAAENLTPVTLELGGKSPTIINSNYPIAKAVDRIMMGKFMNSGQTCIAPDYILVHESKVDELVSTFQEKLAKRYPTLDNNNDISWIVNDRHFTRITNLIKDAQDRGAQAVQVNPTDTVIAEGTRIIPPTLLLNVDPDSNIMQEEIFGPVLPVITYRDIDEAIRFVNERPRPLALYYFDQNKKQAEEVLSRTISGGACVNETMLHFANEKMAFGGIGPSGLGGYHGHAGFLEFSHKKSVIFQGALSPAPLMNNPYPKVVVKILKVVSKILS